MSQTVQQNASQEPVVPKGGIIAAAALVLFSLATVTTVRLTGMGEVHMALPAAVQSRDLQFADGRNGAVLVYDAGDHRLIDTLAPGSNGFIRVVLRGLARERRLGDIGAQPPFRLTRYSGGQITLTDTSTNKQIDLGAFGSTNTEAFARLMTLQGGAT
jgi:putative photosynthetic complex assembly protein